MLIHPILHLSGYLNANRGRYVDSLYRVSSEDALDDWMSFFCEGLISQSRYTSDIVRSLLDYREMLRRTADNIHQSGTVDLLFRNPYVRSSDVAESLGISLPTANKTLEELVSKGVLREVTRRKRNRLYRADGILEILR